MVRIFPPKNNLDEKQKIIHIIKSNMYNQKIIRVICNIQTIRKFLQNPDEQNTTQNRD